MKCVRNSTLKQKTQKGSSSSGSDNIFGAPLVIILIVDFLHSGEWRGCWDKTLVPTTWSSQSTLQQLLQLKGLTLFVRERWWPCLPEIKQSLAYHRHSFIACTCRIPITQGNDSSLPAFPPQSCSETEWSLSVLRLCCALTAYTVMSETTWSYRSNALKLKMTIHSMNQFYHQMLNFE